MCLKKETELVLSFLEEARDYGVNYAQNRLWQRWKVGHYKISDVGKAATMVGKKIEQQYSGERFGYLFVLVAYTLVAVSGLLVVLDPGVSSVLQLFACFVVPVAVLLVKIYWKNFKSTRERQAQTKHDLEALYKAFGGMLQL